MRLAPDVWQAFVQLTFVLSREKSGRKEALAAASEAVALAPHEADTHLALGVAAAAARRPAEAQTAFQQVLAIDPQNSIAHNELARLQLSKANLTRPTALGEAAGSFAAAVRSDPRADVSRRNFELVIRMFLSRVSYLVFLDAWLVGQTVSHSSSGGARLLPVALLALPLVFAANFLRSLTPDLRRHVLRATIGRRLLVPVALETTAITLLIVGALAPTSAPVAATAAALALVARLYLYASIASHTAGGRALGRRVHRLVTIGLGLLTAVVTVVAVVAAGSGRHWRTDSCSDLRAPLRSRALHAQTHQDTVEQLTQVTADGRRPRAASGCLCARWPMLRDLRLDSSISRMTNGRRERLMPRAGASTTSATIAAVVAIALVATAADASSPSLGLAQPPYLGVSCPGANVTACGRVGIAVWVSGRPSTIEAEIVGRTVRLDPPPRVRGRKYWQGFVYLNLRRLGLPVRWFGTKPYKVLALRLTIHRGTNRARGVLRATLHPGWG